MEVLLNCSSSLSDFEAQYGTRKNRKSEEDRDKANETEVQDEPEYGGVKSRNERGARVSRNKRWKFY